VRQEHALRAKIECWRKSGHVSISLKHGLAIHNNPRVTQNSVVQTFEPNDESRISADAREYAIKQQAALNTVSVSQASELTKSDNTGCQPSLGFPVTRTSWDTPRPLGE
jgi:hypothetical protein